MLGCGECTILIYFIGMILPGDVYGLELSVVD
jgi:hypothetical protein